MASEFTLRYFDKKWHVAADGDYPVMVGIVRGQFSIPMIVNPDWTTVAWSIIRASDGLIIAQSKNAPDSTSAPADPQPAPVADSELPFAEGIDDDSEPVTDTPSEPTYLVINNVIDCDPMEFDTDTEVAEHLREYEADGEDLWGYTVARVDGTFSLRATYWFEAYETEHPTPLLPVADSEPQGEGVFKVGDSLIGQANIWTHNHNDMPRPVATDWRKCHQSAWLFAERENATGHGRTSRNRANKGHRRDLKASKLSSTVNMEKNSVAAKQWRNRRNLANAVAMPTPTITGAELMARGQQLTVVEKPKLTRILEGRAA